MHRRKGRLACLLHGLAILWMAAAAAQDGATPAAPKPGPEVIAPSEIPSRADSDERYAQDVIQRSSGRDRLERLEPRLETLTASVHSESERFKRDELKLLSITRLESLARHWSFYGEQLAAWRRDLQQASGQYTEDAAELARRRAAWENTRSAAEASGMAPALQSRIQATLAQITLAEQAVSGPIDRQTRLSRRANVLETSIIAGQKAVSAAIAYNDSRLSYVDSPPLWVLLEEPEASGSALKSLQAGLEVEKQFLDEYNAANADYHRRKNVLALLLLPLLAWLSFRSRRVIHDDPEMQAATRVLRRPISSWIVLVMVGTLVFEPDAPALLHQSVLLLALIPVLRLLPPAVFQLLGPWPYVATGLYLLKHLNLLFLGNALHHRLYLLTLTLLAAVLLAWVLWRRRPRAAAEQISTARKMIRRAGWAAIVVLLISAFANVVGNASLAEMLTVAIVDSSYIGLVLFAGVTVMASVLRLFFARRAVSRFRIVTQHVGPLIQGVTRLLRFGAVAGWVVVVLNSFRVYRPVQDATIAVLAYELKLGEISLTLGGALLFLFSVWLAFWIAKTTRLLLQDEVLPKMSLPRGVGNSVSSLTYYALLLIGIFVALAASGFEISQLAIVVGALGVGIGFGLQNVVNNFVSGLILMFERPIQPGDVVEITGTSGKVREIGMRATTLTTFEGADVVVPNGTLLSEKLINWTLSDMDRRVDVNVGVAYGSDARRVLDLLLEVTKATPGVADQPEPAVVFTGFGASSLDFGIRAWTNEFGEWVRIRTELTVRVYEALRAAGIEIPFPQQDLHLRSVAPEAGAVLAGQRPPEPRVDQAPPAPQPAPG